MNDEIDDELDFFAVVAATATALGCKMHQIRFFSAMATPHSPLGELTALPRTPN